MMSRKQAVRPTQPQHLPFDKFLQIHHRAEEQRQKKLEADLTTLRQLISGKEDSKDAQPTQGKDTI